MLTPALESLLRRAEANYVTEFFLLLLLVWLVIALVSVKKGQWPRFTAYTPMLLTSLGILGTFIGIVVGLLDFDPENLAESIGPLLEGLKTAFISSLAGMGSGILFKVLSITSLFQPKIVKEEDEIGPEDILATLKEQKELLQATRDAIAGSEESSLAGQMKLLRTDLQDQNRQGREAHEEFKKHLWEKLDDFAQMLSRSATEQVIEALKQVIVDFNRNLTEQFGENFKALDASVQKLVQWQEGYRQQLEELHKLYDQSVEGAASIERAVASIAESCLSIPQSMENLTTIVETANHQLAELERHLAAFQEMRERVVEAVPQVQTHVEEMTNQIAASVDTASEHYRRLLDVSDAYIEAQNQLAQDMLEKLTRAGERVQQDTQAVQQRVADSIQQMQQQMEAQNQLAQGMLGELTRAGERVQEDTQAVQQRVADSIQRMQQQMEATLRETLVAQNQAVSQVVEGLREQMEQAVSDMSEGVNAQLEALDEARDRELERVMNGMGEALAQITGRFVEDYTALTEAMHRIVRQGRDER